jgi:hypothetical protein
MENIFTITGIPYDYPKNAPRCFGWRRLFEDAERDVLNNKCLNSLIRDNVIFF